MVDLVSKWPGSLWLNWSWYIGQQLWCSLVGSYLHGNRGKRPLKLLCQDTERRWWWYSNNEISEMQSTPPPVIGRDDSSSPWRFIYGSTRISPGRWKYHDCRWVCVLVVVPTCFTIGRSAIVGFCRSSRWCHVLEGITTSQEVAVDSPFTARAFTPLSATVDELQWLIS
jgi:hypothetical protein